MDSLTVAIGVGLVFSLFFAEVVGLSAGGLVVPGYMAFCLDRPGDVTLTLLLAAAAYAICLLLSRVTIVYGRRRIVVMLLVSFLLGSLVRSALAWEALPSDQAPAVVGYIIPGLIALWMDRQGAVETISSLLTASVVVRLVLICSGTEMLA